MNAWLDLSGKNLFQKLNLFTPDTCPLSIQVKEKKSVPSPSTADLSTVSINSLPAGVTQ